MDRTILELLQGTSRAMRLKASDQKKEPAMVKEMLDLEKAGYA